MTQLEKARKEIAECQKVEYFVCCPECHGDGCVKCNRRGYMPYNTKNHFHFDFSNPTKADRESLYKFVAKCRMDLADSMYNSSVRNHT